VVILRDVRPADDYRSDLAQSLAGRNPAALASVSVANRRVQFLHVKFGHDEEW
jgi:hypothetical protein